jgi:hypothetical protein
LNGTHLRPTCDGTTVLGTIDLDPASNALAQSWIQAEKIYTKDDNGLFHLWKAENVYVNPPYGRDVEAWLIKAINSYQIGDLTACIMLLNRTGARGIKNVSEKLQLFVRSIGG